MSWRKALKHILPAAAAMIQPALAMNVGLAKVAIANKDRLQGLVPIAAGGLAAVFAPEAMPLVGAALGNLHRPGEDADIDAVPTPASLIPGGRNAMVTPWTAGQVLEGGIGGAGVGSIFGPIGAAVGGIIGAGGTILANPDDDEGDDDQGDDVYDDQEDDQ